MEIDEVRRRRDFHLRQPGVSLKRWKEKRTSELRQTLEGKRFIYLDVNYWIDLAEAEARGTVGFHGQLLAVLTAGVAAGAIVCPVSAITASEVARQTDHLSRSRTARLMDELSRSTALLSPEDLIPAEIARFLLSALTEGPLPPLGAGAFSRTGCVLAGEMPVIPGLMTPQKQKAYEKAFFDAKWDMRLEDALATGGTEGNPLNAAAARINHQNREHAGALTSFSAAYAAEARGLIEACAPSVGAAVTALMAHLKGPPRQEPLDGGWMILLVNALVETDTAKRHLPTLHTLAGLHALSRWDKRRGFKANDIPDYHHAAGALGYFDLFLTERSLKTSLERGPLKLALWSGRQVVANPSEAVSAARALTAEVSG